ncbi:hypothetical protein DPMN_008177 [Dreissena polymorpha]|uniref:Potassium channel domain-containing protein n=1 Tax=Dreissena polymorpha TaxID=45954 RepID=A0A9D4MZV6_DREPO|nr:hypothetical protein DPMN_008177 [Dreissena polymorpha]
MTTIGYGDVSPSTCLGRVVASLCGITGVIMLAISLPMFVNNFVKLNKYASLNESIENETHATACSSPHVEEKVKNAQPPGGHIFQATGIIFGFLQRYNWDRTLTNLLTKFYEDRKNNVASRVKNAPPLGGHVFQPTGIIFNLVQDIIGMNLLTRFHEDRTINAASRVLI